MASSSSSSAGRLISTFTFFLVIFLSSIVTARSSLVFHVGGSKGWIVPPSNETDAYNRWAIQNRFHVGDSLYFKYTNDSVLVVDREDYHQCRTADPLQVFADGNTTFRFDRYGFFNFISGTPGHCQEGQRLVVRVMVHPAGVTTPAASPAPSPAAAASPAHAPASAAPQPGGGAEAPGPGISGHKTSAAASIARASFGVVLTVLGVILFV